MKLPLLPNLSLNSKNLNTDDIPSPSSVNEAVNFDLQAIFIAVPKTGTTSVRTQIRPGGKALIDAPHLNIVQVRDALYVHLLKAALGHNRSYPSQGVPTDADIRQKSQEIFNTFFKFASVRNPWARTVSIYFRREGVRTASALSFDDFCENYCYSSDTCRYPTQHKNQLDWLVDESDQVIMDYVYKVENFETAIKDIAERTDGRVQLMTRRSNKNPKSKSGSYRDLYTDHTRNLIAKRFEKDIDFFKYAF